MLSENYLNIEKIILADLNIVKDKLNSALIFVQKANKGDYIYSEKLINDFKFSEEESIRFLSILKREEILEIVYRLFCPTCDTIHPEKFYKQLELEKVEECPYCGAYYNIEENPYKYLVIWFKKK